MLPPLTLVEQQANRTEHHLMLYLIKEQQETNRLLRQLSGIKEGHEEIKRPELMKRMAKLESKPPGWNKWSNEQILAHLQEVAS